MSDIILAAFAESAAFVADRSIMPTSIPEMSTTIRISTRVKALFFGNFTNFFPPIPQASPYSFLATRYYMSPTFKST